MTDISTPIDLLHGFAAGKTTAYIAPTYDVEVPDVGEHGVRVDLAHVVPLVLLLHVAHHQVPRVVLVVRHLEAWDARDDVVVDRQDHLPVQVDERDLQKKYIK